MIKTQIKKLFRHFGYRVVPLNYHHIDYYESLETVRHQWLTQFNIRTILDAGAGSGQFARTIRKTFPSARLVCFEPIDACFQEIRETFRNDPNTSLNKLALGSKEGSFVFHIHRNPGSSSFLRMTDIHTNAYPGSGESETAVIPTIRLEDYLNTHSEMPEFFLKLDTQGTELDILKGAGDWIHKMRVIQIELNFAETYEQCPLFDEVYQFLRTRHFILAGIENASQSLVDGSFLQCDAFFIRET